MTKEEYASVSEGDTVFSKTPWSIVVHKATLIRKVGTKGIIKMEDNGRMLVKSYRTLMHQNQLRQQVR